MLAGNGYRADPSFSAGGGVGDGHGHGGHGGHGSGLVGGGAHELWPTGKIYDVKRESDNYTPLKLAQLFAIHV